MVIIRDLGLEGDSLRWLGIDADLMSRHLFVCHTSIDKRVTYQLVHVVVGWLIDWVGFSI